MSQKNDFGSVIKSRGFTNLWINQILVQLSYNSLNFALIIWVFRLTNSNTAVSALLFAVYLPAVLFGLFAGVVVDSIDRKKIIVVIDLLLSFGFASLILLKYNYPAILAVTFFINTLAQFYIPAESSAIAIIVKRNQLLQANSLFSITLFLTMLVGFGLAGPIIALWGINFVFLGGSVFLITAFLLANRFPKIVARLEPDTPNLIKNLRAGKWETLKPIVTLEMKKTLKLIRHNLPVSMSIFILAGVQAIIGVLAVLVPSFLERVLQISATDASYVLIAPLGVGLILGALIVGRIGGKLARRKLVGRSVLLVGILFLSVGIAPLISPATRYFPHPKPLAFISQPSLSFVMAIGAFFIGLAMAAIVIPSQTVLQENTPEADRGKVFAVLGMMMATVSIIPVVFAGVLADIFGPMPIFIGLGGSIGIMGLMMLKPDFFFEERHLSFRWREFLGLGHWKR